MHKKIVRYGTINTSAEMKETSEASEQLWKHKTERKKNVVDAKNQDKKELVERRKSKSFCTSYEKRRSSKSAHKKEKHRHKSNKTLKHLSTEVKGTVEKNENVNKKCNEERSHTSPQHAIVKIRRHKTRTRHKEDKEDLNRRISPMKQDEKVSFHKRKKDKHGIINLSKVRSRSDSPRHYLRIDDKKRDPSSRRKSIIKKGKSRKEIDLGPASITKTVDVQEKIPAVNNVYENDSKEMLTARKKSIHKIKVDLDLKSYFFNLQRVIDKKIESFLHNEKSLGNKEVNDKSENTFNSLGIFETKLDVPKLEEVNDRSEEIGKKKIKIRKKKKEGKGDCEMKDDMLKIENQFKAPQIQMYYSYKHSINGSESVKSCLSNVNMELPKFHKPSKNDPDYLKYKKMKKQMKLLKLQRLDIIQQNEKILMKQLKDMDENHSEKLETKCSITIPINNIQITEKCKPRKKKRQEVHFRNPPENDVEEVQNKTVTRDLGNFFVEGVEPPNLLTLKHKKRKKRKVHLECKTVSIIEIKPENVRNKSLIDEAVSIIIDGELIERKMKTEAFQYYYKYKGNRNNVIDDHICGMISDSNRFNGNFSETASTKSGHAHRKSEIAAPQEVKNNCFIIDVTQSDNLKLENAELRLSPWSETASTRNEDALLQPQTIESNNTVENKNSELRLSMNSPKSIKHAIKQSPQVQSSRLEHKDSEIRGSSTIRSTTINRTIKQPLQSQSPRVRKDDKPESKHFPGKVSFMENSLPKLSDIKVESLNNIKRFLSNLKSKKIVENRIKNNLVTSFVSRSDINLRGPNNLEEKPILIKSKSAVNIHLLEYNKCHENSNNKSKPEKSATKKSFVSKIPLHKINKEYIRPKTWNSLKKENYEKKIIDNEQHIYKYQKNNTSPRKSIVCKSSKSYLDVRSRKENRNETKTNSLIELNKLTTKKNNNTKIESISNSLDKYMGKSHNQMSCFFLTKDYKQDQKISAFQKRKFYDDQIRKKMLKKIAEEKKSSPPQVFEVRYVSVLNGTALEENNVLLNDDNPEMAVQKVTPKDCVANFVICCNNFHLPTEDQCVMCTSNDIIVKENKSIIKNITKPTKIKPVSSKTNSVMANITNRSKIKNKFFKPKSVSYATRYSASKYKSPNCHMLTKNKTVSTSYTFFENKVSQRRILTLSIDQETGTKMKTVETFTDCNKNDLEIQKTNTATSPEILTLCDVKTDVNFNPHKDSKTETLCSEDVGTDMNFNSHRISKTETLCSEDNENIPTDMNFNFHKVSKTETLSSEGNENVPTDMNFKSHEVSKTETLSSEDDENVRIDMNFNSDKVSKTETLCSECNENEENISKQPSDISETNNIDVASVKHTIYQTFINDQDNFSSDTVYDSNNAISYTSVDKNADPSYTHIKKDERISLRIGHETLNNLNISWNRRPSMLNASWKMSCPTISTTAPSFEFLYENSSSEHMLKTTDFQETFKPNQKFTQQNLYVKNDLNRLGKIFNNYDITKSSFHVSSSPVSDESGYASVQSKHCFSLTNFFKRKNIMTLLKPSNNNIKSDDEPCKSCGNCFYYGKKYDQYKKESQLYVNNVNNTLKNKCGDIEELQYEEIPLKVLLGTSSSEKVSLTTSSSNEVKKEKLRNKLNKIGYKYASKRKIITRNRRQISKSYKKTLKSTLSPIESKDLRNSVSDLFKRIEESSEKTDTTKLEESNIMRLDTIENVNLKISTEKLDVDTCVLFKKLQLHQNGYYTDSSDRTTFSPRSVTTEEKFENVCLSDKKSEVKILEQKISNQKANYTNSSDRITFSPRSITDESEIKSDTKILEENISNEEILISGSHDFKLNPIINDSIIMHFKSKTDSDCEGDSEKNRMLKESDSKSSVMDPIMNEIGHKLFDYLFSTFEKENAITKRLYMDTDFFKNELSPLIERVNDIFDKKFKKGLLRMLFKNKKFNLDTEISLVSLGLQGKTSEEYVTNMERGVFDEIMMLCQKSRVPLNYIARNSRRRFSSLVQAVMTNMEMDHQIKFCRFLKILESIEDKNFSVIRKDPLNLKENIVLEIKQNFLRVYQIALLEAKNCKRKLTTEDIGLLTNFAINYCCGIVIDKHLVAAYIGKGLLNSETKLREVVKYLLSLNKINDIDICKLETKLCN